MQSLSSVTLGDIAKGLKRYQPFILVVVAVLLIVVVLPGKPSHNADLSANQTPTNDSRLTGGAGQQAVGVTPDASGTTPGAGSLAPDSGGIAGSGGTGDTGGTGGGGGTNRSGVAPDANCDTGRGRIKVPSLYALPCPPAFAGKNAGATWQGVTANEITIVHYNPKPDPATQAVLAAAGDNDQIGQINQTFDDYVQLLQHHVQTYGRKIKLIHVDGTGAVTDDAAGQADAKHIAKDLKAFMVWGSINDAFVNEMVADHVICICTTTLPKDYYAARSPYVWGNGLPDENQAYIMRAEMIGKQIAGQKASHAGDPDLLVQNRSFGLIWYNTGQNSYAPGEKFFEQQLATYGVKLKDSASYIFDTNSAQQTSDTIMAKFKSEHITSVIFVGDPIYPVFYTEAATKQNYHPEWVITGSALTDTTFFARVYDKSQWRNAFGLSLLAARGPQTEGDAYRMYDWRFHKKPPAPNTYSTLYPTVLESFIGIQGAGSALTPATFKTGMFAYPNSPTKPGVTLPLVSFGRHIWSWDDYNLFDDSTEIWWDNAASGPDELGHGGVGMYRFVDMGKRYMPGQFPRTPFKAFDAGGTVTVYDHIPASDIPPDYGPEKDFYK